MPRLERKELFLFFIIIVSTVSIYAQIFHFEFVNYDDPSYVYDNNDIQSGLTLKNISWAFTTFSNSNWHPVTWLSHMVDIDLFGLHAGYHHLVNLFIHVCNTILLYLLFRLSTNNINKSTVLAAFFALHPLHVESVAWIAERKDLLCGFFWLASMLAYYRYTKRPSPVRYFFVFFYFVLGSLSKPMIVTLPFVLLLFDYWPLNRHICYNKILHPQFKKHPWIWLVIEKIPMIVISLIISCIAVLSQSSGGSVVDIQEIPISIRIANSLVSYIVYIKKMIWPGDLSVLYPFAMPSFWLSLIGLVSIIGILIASFILRKNHSYLLSGFLWFFGTLIPVIGIIQVGSQAMADRYTYIPSIGFFAAIIWGGTNLINQFVPDKSLNKFLLMIITSTALVLMMLLSYSQVRYWRNSITLMTNAIQVTKNNYTAHENLGLALTALGLHDEGVFHFKQAVAINPDFAPAYMNIGSYHLLRKEYDQAIAFYQKTIGLNPSLVRAYALMGKALYASGKPEDAVRYFEKVQQVSPGNFNLRQLTEIEKTKEN